ncbi:T9SS type A sorting domain-containing protein [Williamwhitmania taraxaci]|uniref:Por secretion system C-terminal sorting domain-containing protein n=1 Tax=Williamwhitmania taraxaci TaxID=1640674 RepID=A0A1G6T3Y0_9BACT|nr:T9SS type A sorting domain-containing protein [Williamwhitmania taraxaci]SDD23663.1 Por secretion system C-terminal sorting domain-containing protein [Williamwhitmania taraxaci]
MKHTILTITGLLLIGLNGLKAQDAIPTTGGNATGVGGSASYTVGQVIYTTNTGTSGSVAQGVQQPYEISVVSGIGDNKINLSCSTYPNPTTDKLTLRIETNENLNLTYQLFDITGKLLESKKVEGSETNISMGSLTPAIYFLKVSDGAKEVKTFKIIKN